VIEIRPLIQFEEFAEAVRLQQTNLGFDDIEMLPCARSWCTEKIAGNCSAPTTAMRWSHSS